MGIAHKGGGKPCQNGLGHFFHVAIAWGCKGLPGWFRAFLSTFARLMGGEANAIWAMPIYIGPTKLKKGFPEDRKKSSSKINKIEIWPKSSPKVINSQNKSHRDHIWGMFEL